MTHNDLRIDRHIHFLGELDAIPKDQRKPGMRVLVGSVSVLFQVSEYGTWNRMGMVLGGKLIPDRKRRTK